VDDVSEYLDPKVFTAGTVGPPGQRTFYLQACDDGTVSSVRLEKQQVSALAEYLAGMLHDLPAPADVPAAPELVEPVEAEWTVGNIGVAYDNDLDRIIIVAEELVAEDEPEGQSLRVVISRSQVRAFIERAEELMDGGRPPCRVCGAPMDPAGHACPRAN
jgi:uncharacterized repeat protein (TIGR03847 family)